MKTSRTYIAKTKLKALAWMLGITLATVGTIFSLGLNALPVIGVAMVAAAMSIGKVASRFDRPTCLSCGHDLAKEPVGVHGIGCPECGSVNMPRDGADDALALESSGDDAEA